MVKPQQLPTLIKIKEVLAKGDYSIADLQKQTGIKRSTLNYYLGVLEKEGFITKRRIKTKATGRPTIIRLDKFAFEERRRKLQKEKENHLKNPLLQKILSYSQKGVEEKKLYSLINSGEKQYLLSPHLEFLIREGLINRNYTLTQEGEAFLKKHK